MMVASVSPRRSSFLWRLETAGILGSAGRWRSANQLSSLVDDRQEASHKKAIIVPERHSHGLTLVDLDNGNEFGLEPPRE
jgi:hypothetical protein